MIFQKVYEIHVATYPIIFLANHNTSEVSEVSQVKESKHSACLIPSHYLDHVWSPHPFVRWCAQPRGRIRISQRQRKRRDTLSLHTHTCEVPPKLKSPAISGAMRSLALSGQ